ncbi:MAG: VOC family protein [Cyanobacteria bacterium J06650_10]
MSPIPTFEPPTFELDHLFICTDINAPAANRLRELGLTEGLANRHPGQGTENRRFFFHNAMLELLWVYSPEEAQSEAIRRTHLWERWQQRSQRQICPFGLCLRPTADHSAASPLSPLFSAWDFRPPYLPPSLSISVGNNSHLLAEPMLFQTPFSKRPDQKSSEKLLPLNHALGLTELTGVVLSMPAGVRQLSAELNAVLDATQIKLQEDSQYYVELLFDGETKKQQADLRPDLPLIIRW